MKKVDDGQQGEQDLEQERKRQKQADGAAKRRLERRDTEGQAARVVQAKLLDQGYPAALIEHLRNERGCSIMDMVQEEIRTTRGVKKYLGASFWRKVFSEFPLNKGNFSNLPEVEGDVPLELEDALLPAYSENPAQRTIEPFTRYLDTVATPSKHFLIGLLHACAEGPVVSRKQSHAMIVSALTCIGKHGLQKAYPDVWSCVSSVMDSHLTAHYKSWPLDIDSYVEGHLDALRAVVDAEALDAVWKARAACKAMDPQSLSKVLETKVGSTIFVKEAIAYCYSRFVQTRDRLLADLMAASFEEAQLEEFRALMMREAVLLGKQGVKPYETKESCYEFLTLTVPCTVSSVTDDWEFALQAMAKTIAVSQSTLPRLPWEVACFGSKDKLPGVAETVTVPPSLVKKNFLARSATLKLFSGVDVDTLTFAQMKSEVGRRRGELCFLDRSFVQEMEFLFGHAEKCVEEKVHAMLLEAMPSESPAYTVAETTKAIGLIRQPHMVMASRAAVMSEIEGILGFLSALEEGRPPAFASLGSMSSFFRSIVRRAEFFITTSRKKVGSKTLFPAQETVYGRDALELILNDFLDGEGDEVRDRSKVLTAFRWLLTQEECESVEVRMRAVIRSRRASITNQALGDKAPASASSSSVGGQIVPQGVDLSTVDDGEGTLPREERKQAAESSARARLRAILKGK